MKRNIYYKSACNMEELADESINIVVTSPPYPMVEMWDDIFAMQNKAIACNLADNTSVSFDLMHGILNNIWMECYRVLSEGGFLCINIGDATRTINGNFQLFNNHSKISQFCRSIGFTELPCVIWRKQTNAPNKFMGSGMLPCGAYVTLEHEYILIFRKGKMRKFKTDEEKKNRRQSAFFWEERNTWFSDTWDVKGVKQKMPDGKSRTRSAAFPYEIPYRLINMYSCKGDTVLDPFLGLGTTMQAALDSDRNFVGYEIDKTLEEYHESLSAMQMSYSRTIASSRILQHNRFVTDRVINGKDLKYFNKHLGCKVMTKQEQDIKL